MSHKYGKLALTLFDERSSSRNFRLAISRRSDAFDNKFFGSLELRSRHHILNHQIDTFIPLTRSMSQALAVLTNSQCT